ncbi:hypothetical protein J2Y55_000669 [Bosea sp. BE125]|nr:hypothetical protein [Bosea sp. BE125]
MVFQAPAGGWGKAAAGSRSKDGATAVAMYDLGRLPTGLD